MSMSSNAHHADARRERERLPPSLAKEAGGESGRPVSGFQLACERCRWRCAVDAKFCGNCGAKLKHTVFSVMRAKLPSLDKYRPSTVSPSRPGRELLPQFKTAESVAAADFKRVRKRQHPSNKRVIRVHKLESQHQPPISIVKPIQPREHSQRAEHAIEADVQGESDTEWKVKVWMASTRRLLESLLELKRRIERPELEVLEAARFQSVAGVIDSLDRDLLELDAYFIRDRNLQAKCQAMLLKMRTLHVQTRDRLQSTVDAIVHHNSPPSTSTPAVSDAEIVVRAPDGKKMFFKSRASPRKELSVPVAPLQVSAMVVPHLAAHCAIRQNCDQENELEQERDSSALNCVPVVSQFVLERWPSLLVFRLARVHGRTYFLRLEESDELNQLFIYLYRPLTSVKSVVVIPFGWLKWILPPSLVWYRSSEIRRHRTVEEYWDRCLARMLRCLKLEAYDSFSIHFPIQFRAARMFTFRTFAIFYGVVSVHLQHDYALKVMYLNVQATHKATVLVAEKTLTTWLSTYREHLTEPSSRKLLFAQVCDKLYFEYTSRGYELLFPGVKPRGAIRKHPLEISLIQNRADQIEQERKQLVAVMDKCIQETMKLARRWLEQYHERVRRVRKVRQEQAAKKIQARTRGLIAKKKFRRQREEKRRSSCVQDLAAMLIQREFRRRRDHELQQRQRNIQRRDACGVRFRRCCRINSTYAMVIVTLDEIDAESNVVDCVVHIVHPVTTQAAQLRVHHSELLYLCRQSSFQKWSRREIVDALVFQHLDLFRSAQHNILVVVTKP